MIDTVLTVLYWVVGVLFTGAALCVLYRIVRGPSLLDRMIASDVLATTLLLVVGAEMVYNQHTRTVPMMLALAAIAIFATVAVARYVSKQDKQSSDEGDLTVRGSGEDVDPTTDGARA